MSPIAHGTRQGYQACRERHGGACQPCRDANAAYMADWRAANPPLVDANRRYSRARRRALSRLADQHRADFLRLLSAELAGANREEIR